MVLTDGAAHAVDSSELAFKLAAVYAFRDAVRTAGPVVMEPIMVVEVTVPSEFQVGFFFYNYYNYKNLKSQAHVGQRCTSLPLCSHLVEALPACLVASK